VLLESIKEKHTIHNVATAVWEGLVELEHPLVPIVQKENRPTMIIVDVVVVLQDIEK